MSLVGLNKTRFTWETPKHVKIDYFIIGLSQNETFVHVANVTGSNNSLDVLNLEYSQR